MGTCKCKEAVHRNGELCKLVSENAEEQCGVWSLGGGHLSLAQREKYLSSHEVHSSEYLPV